MSSNLKVNTILPSTGTAIGIGTAAGNVDILGHIVGHNTPNISGINSVTANHFYGNGANITGIALTSLNVNANVDNRLITATGNQYTVQGESNLTYDGTNLQLTTDANNEGIKIDGGTTYPVFEMDANRSAGNTLGKLVQKWNGTQVASISFVSGSDASNKDDGIMYFNTASSGTPLERLRITSSGALGTNSTVRSANGGLDLCSQGATNYGTLTLGAGGGQNGQSRSSNQENQFRIMMPTYANPSNMTTVLYGTSGSGGHDLHYGGGTGWAYATNTHRFFTTANQTTGNGTERIRVNSSGEVNVPAGITLGQSISSTAASNTLDDYEEGSYVVTVTGSTSGSFALNPNSFRYTKVGRVVHISGRFYVVSGSPTGSECRISLPFTASSHIQSQDGSAYSYVTTYNAYSPNNDYQMANSVIAGNAYSVLIWVVPNAAWQTVSPSSHMNQRNAYYGFDFSYTTAT